VVWPPSATARMWSKSVPGDPHVRHDWSRSRTAFIWAAVIRAARALYRLHVAARLRRMAVGSCRGSASMRSRIVVLRLSRSHAP
jgi:hypothetical protein